jgi:hypothetical protein
MVSHPILAATHQTSRLLSANDVLRILRVYSRTLHPCTSPADSGSWPREVLLCFVSVRGGMRRAGLRARRPGGHWLQCAQAHLENVSEGLHSDIQFEVDLSGSGSRLAFRGFTLAARILSSRTARLAHVWLQNTPVE